jgi:DNA-binding NtrC family response regulator
MRLLIIGSLDGHVTEAGRIALSRGAKVNHVSEIDAGLNALRSGQGADLVLIDVKLDVGRLIDALRSERIVVPVVACGVSNDAGAAVRAIKAGAREYIPLPPNAELIAAVIEAVAEESNALIHNDPAMERMLKLADQIAPSEASVLITGESGTGKEVLARYLHRKSRRSDKKFVSVNCAAIPETLLESELFGHEKGAFTGAVARRLGKFEEANGGTLLLDEISEMEPRLQAKLLRAIQEREIDRLGGTQPVKIDIRLIATSNRDLEDSVRRGTFREDLYYRLNVVHFALPPLRDRPRDVALLAEHFARKYAEANGVAYRPLSAEALTKLRQHGWRGNVRELENTLHRAVLIAMGETIDPDSILLQHTNTQTDDGGSGSQPVQIAAQRAAAATGASNLVGRTVADVERDLIIDTLTHCLGNRTHAATILGISIRTLRNKLKLYSDAGIPVPLPGEGDRAMM